MRSRRETLLCRYGYDALDRLIANELASKPEYHRFYCKSRLATEIHGANRYSMFQHGDQLLAQKQREGDAPDATLLATDQQRSVLHTLKASHPRQPIAYTPYGHHRPGNGLLSLLCFNGERPDPVTGHYLLGNGYRAFNPVLMRFNSPDSWSPFGEGGLNSYAYCLGDPISQRDPSGHSIRIHNPTRLNNALAARTRVLEIEQTLDIKSYRNSLYTEDLNAAQRPMDLKKLAALSTPPSVIESTSLPKFLSSYIHETATQFANSADERALLKFIKNPPNNETLPTAATYNPTILNFAALGNGDARIEGKMVNPEVAKAYQRKMLNIREHPRHEELHAERTKLLKDHLA